MSNQSSYTGKFRVSTNNESSAAKVTKRPRPSTVCNQCRKNKLRCDRGQPCGSCVRRGEDDACSYHWAPASRTDPSRNLVAEDRLVHLESMVKQLMESQTPSSSGNNTVPEYLLPPATSQPAMARAEPAEPSPFAPLDETQYAGFTHWSAILDDIHELKVALRGSPEMVGAEVEPEGPPPLLDSEPIFGSSKHYSLQQILQQYLPPKAELDRLLALYFRGRTFIVPFIHTYDFQRQYLEFWADTATVNPLWLSLLFSICTVGSLIEGTNPPPRSSEYAFAIDSSVLLHAAGQCLVLGSYHRPQRFAPEALAMYAHCKNMRTLDTCREAAAILSIAIRIACEMGYHRDADSFGSFTVFEGEMRRRFWATCIQMDLMLSFQLGLPNNINLDNCDTKSPRNLSDVDFDADTKVLPAARSENEPTYILWFIVKDRQISNFSKVCHDALSFKEKADNEIVELDQDIREMHNTIPPILRTRPLSESIADPPFMVITRLYVEFIYLKSLCVLHRKYMARGGAFSTRCCVEAGITMVSQFIDMYKEFKPGGLLHNERWMLGNFTMNDFLMAVMVLCLVVHLRHKNGAANSAVDDAMESEIRELLEQSHGILVEKSKESKDARRVSYAVRFTLNDARKKATAPSAPAPLTTISPAAAAAGAGSSLKPPNTDTADDAERMATGSNFSTPFLPQPSLQGDESAFGQLDPFNFMGQDFENFDWNIADPGDL